MDFQKWKNRNRNQRNNPQGRERDYPLDSTGGPMSNNFKETERASFVTKPRRGQIPKEQRCGNIQDPVERRECSRKSMDRKLANQSKQNQPMNLTNNRSNQNQPSSINMNRPSPQVNRKRRSTNTGKNTYNEGY